MSFECQYRSGDRCMKMNVECRPGRKGCVIEGKIAPPPENFDKFDKIKSPESIDKK